MTRGMPPADRCLNCGALLSGPFCSACGQRAVPANPTVTELAGDAWQELSGYDGRISATVRGLFHPGRLTRHYLDGRRAHYLPPLRLYLAVSVLYFVVAAAVPSLDGTNGRGSNVGGIRIEFPGAANANAVMTPEEREQLRARVASAPRWLQPTLRALVEDPAGFRMRIFTIMPRVFFGMLPVFAAIVSLFYRGRTFPTSLVFAVHLHAFAFLVLTVSEAVKFMESIPAAVIAAVLSFVLLAGYVLLAFRRIFGGGWPMIIGKTVAIGVVYLFASMPAFMIALLWAAL